MLEKDLENLIARYPEEFFPGQGFRLVAQQYSVGGKRIDILFEDKHQRKIIVEVKRGVLSREASGQVAEYYGLLKAKNIDQFFELVLAANVIPPERRMFLENIGIECKQLGIARVSEVASKYGYIFSDEEVQSAEEKPIEYQSVSKSSNSVWIFQANPQRYDVIGALSDQRLSNKLRWLVNQRKDDIKRGHIALIWMSGDDDEAGIYALARVESDPAKMPELPEGKAYWLDEGRGREVLRVDLSILKSFVNKPIVRRKLKTIPGLQNLSIFQNAQGTNFGVRDEEWLLISDLI